MMEKNERDYSEHSRIVSTVLNRNDVVHNYERKNVWIWYFMNFLTVENVEDVKMSRKIKVLFVFCAEAHGLITWCL